MPASHLVSRAGVGGIGGAAARSIPRAWSIRGRLGSTRQPGRSNLPLGGHRFSLARAGEHWEAGAVAARWQSCSTMSRTRVGSRVGSKRYESVSGRPVGGHDVEWQPHGPQLERTWGVPDHPSKMMCEWPCGKRHEQEHQFGNPAMGSSRTPRGRSLRGDQLRLAIAGIPDRAFLPSERAVEPPPMRRSPEWLGRRGWVSHM